MKKTEALPSRVGELLAEKYRITRHLGQGGMGVVYEAQHAVVGRRFAVKYLHAELASQREALERFRREARAAGALENENIVSIVDFGLATDGIPYLVMELLVGEDLSRVLARNGPLPVSRAVEIGIQACRGLDAAHAAGIIHRDLKPENLFVCRRGDGTDLIKLLDFGVAKLVPVAGPVTPLTRSGASIGTPFYMPPEQARGAEDLDHRADIYALGVILFEALTGKKPHPGESYNEILYHILTQPALPLASVRPDLPGDLVDTIHGALAFAPEDRPPSAVAFARALGRHAGRQMTPIRSQFELRVARAAAPDLTVEGGMPSPAARPRARVRRALLSVFGLAVAAGLAGWLVRAQGRPAQVADMPDASTAISSSTVAPPSPVRTLGVAVDAQPARPREQAQVNATTTVAAPAPNAAPPPGRRRARAARKPGPAPGHDDAPAAAAGPLFDERNPYQ